MNDNHFDDIGKRLHDMEAEPPKDGWKKIQPAILQTSQPAKVKWLRRNWWIPLIVLIPGLLFQPFSEKEINHLTLSSLVTEGSSVEQTLPPEKDKQTSPETTQTIGGKNLSEEPIENATSGKDPNASENQQIQSNDHQLKLSAINQQNSQAQIETSADFHENKLNDDVSIAPVIENVSDAAITPLRQDITNPTAISERNLTDSLKVSSPDEIGQQKTNGSWRISAAFTPHYISNTVRPLTNDEVFVTEINQVMQVRPSGYGFAAGIGKSITPHFYIDGQLSYSNIQKRIQYDYSDGTVDTLLTVEQADKIYLVSPVYAIQNREISSTYNYIGVRLAATYYFWSTPRTRFNMTATVGVHYLLSSKMKEKISGEWITITTEGNNKMNYSFSAGAGYNISAGKGWELMINPVLSWYLKEEKSQEVPFSLREEALGLNFMLSKTLGSK